jgi:hypothetical protein
MDDNLRVHVGFEDHILFQPVESTVVGRPLVIVDNLAVGRIVGGTGNVLQVQVFTRLTSEIVRQYSLPPITTALYPTASLAHMIEVVQVDCCISVLRPSIYDVAYVMPLAEVESGLFNMSGCYNCFYTRYCLNGTGAVLANYAAEYYFVSRPVEPVSIRLFHSLNHLSGMMKKALYHQGEAAACCRTFRFYFSSEAFCYLFHFLSGVSATSSDARKQAVTMYYDSLSLEAKSRHITKTSLRIVTKQGLQRMQRMLGLGVGLGLTKKKPTKKQPLVHCTEGSYLTSLELGEVIPPELARKSTSKWMDDCVHFIYTEESRQLSVSLKYSKLLINNKDLVLCRIATAEVHQQVIGGAYVSSNFFYNGELLTVIRIGNEYATCRYLRDDDDSVTSGQWDTIDLPLDVVHNCVASFGR